MVLGAVYCPTDKRKSVCERIQDIKSKHGLSAEFEIKWTKVSASKIEFYKDLVDYFYDDDDLGFRAVIADKDTLDHERHGQTHDEWYYKMYFQLLSVVLNPENKYYIYLDIKDTQGARKVQKLQEVLCSNFYDFNQQIIKRVQQIRSEESNLVQLADLLIGAIQASKREDATNTGKLELIEQIKHRTGYSLKRNTLPKEYKTNLFYWLGS